MAPDDLKVEERIANHASMDTWRLPNTLAWNPMELPAGSILYREGAAASRLFSMHAGIVKLVAHLPSGRVRILGLYGRGAILGLETPVSRTGAYNHTAVAVTNLQCAWAPTSHLRRLRHQRSEEYLSLVERYCEELKHAERWITEFSADTTTCRIARVIRYLSELQGLSGPNQVELLTCQEMAEVIGASTESASRVLARFKRMGILTAADEDGGSRYYSFDPAAIDGLAAA